MAKKGFGKLVVLAAAAGAAAAGISYLKKYHSFTKELEKDFHDFEGTRKKIILKRGRRRKRTGAGAKNCQESGHFPEIYLIKRQHRRLKVAAKDYGKCSRQRG